MKLWEGMDTMGDLQFLKFLLQGQMNLWNKTGLGLEENESLTMKITKKRNPMKSESEQGMLLQKVQQWYVL